MALKKISFRTTAAHQGRRLDHVLAECLPGLLNQPISKAKVRKLVVAGAVYLNGRRVRIASKGLFSGLKIEAQVDLEKLTSEFEKSRPSFTMSTKSILFEDEDIIVIDKPTGLPTQPTLDDARENLFLLVKKFLAQRSGQPLEKTYLGLHHRLDRDTSGVILMTKTQRANPGIAETFSKHTAQKIYQALVVRSPQSKSPPQWTIKNYLGKVSHAKKTTMAPSILAVTSPTLTSPCSNCCPKQSGSKPNPSPVVRTKFGCIYRKVACPF